MDLQEIGWEAWTRLLRLKSGTGGIFLRNVAMNLWVPQNAGKLFQ